MPVSFPFFNPVLDVCGGVAVGVVVGNTSDGAKKRSSHLCYQFLFAVRLISETVAKGAIEAAFVPGAVNQLME